ncbi:hypothetical protein NZL82_19680, partial [Sphingomonas sanguinis]|uniref:hypothetical protein n=1 Tax=Sphingomonas sp. LC-1 TaxID=3110957 RepID=UPI0021BAEF4F
GIGLGGSAGGGPGLSANKTTYYTTISQGALIASLTDPFGTGSTYTVVGTAPAQLALASGGRIVAGTGAQADGQASTIIIRASKGSRAVEEPLTFTSVKDPAAPVSPLRVVGTNFQLATNVATASGTRTEIIYRYPFFMGGDCSEIRLSWTAWAMSTFGVSVDTGARTIYKVAVELDGTSTVVPVTFSGQRGASLTGGVNDFQSDPLTPSMFGLTVFPADRKFWVRGIESVSAAGSTWPVGVNNQSVTGARSVVYDPVNRAEQVDTTGTIAAPTGGTTSGSWSTGPCAVLGRFTGTSKALAFLGDSLMDGSNDLANYIGGNGYGPRAVVPTGLTGIVAHMKLTRVGARASDLSQNTKMLA